MPRGFKVGRITGIFLDGTDSVYELRLDSGLKIGETMQNDSGDFIYFPLHKHGYFTSDNLHDIEAVLNFLNGE